VTISPQRPAPRLDLNLLPVRHRPRRLTLGSALTWLLLLALLILLVPAWTWFARTTDAYRRTAEEGERLRQAVAADAGTNADLDTLATRVADTSDQAAQLEAALESLGIRRVLWSDTLALLIEQTPDGITYSSLTDEGGSIRVEGLSPDELAPLVLVRNLTSTEAFETVRLEALDRVQSDAEEPSATPTRQPTPRAGATPSPTPTAAETEPRFSFVLILVVPGASTP